MNKKQINKIHQEFWLKKHSIQIELLKAVAVMSAFILLALLYEWCGMFYPEYL